jgi:XTP/dITP diphosphohydrolase
MRKLNKGVESKLVRQRLIVASKNQGKIQEFRELFKNLKYDVLSMQDFGIDITVIEEQSDFTGNSLKKAKRISELTKQIVLADDSGLEVEALNGLPGVYSARFAGEHATDEENNLKLLSLMKNVPESKRKALFRCAITLYWPDGAYIQVEGTCPGKIGFTCKGEGGFGYDPLFIVAGYNKTMAELPIEEKNKVSHRAMAMRALINKLEDKNKSGVDNKKYFHI